MQVRLPAARWCAGFAPFERILEILWEETQLRAYLSNKRANQIERISCVWASKVAVEVRYACRGLLVPALLQEIYHGRHQNSLSRARKAAQPKDGIFGLSPVVELFARQEPVVRPGLVYLQSCFMACRWVNRRQPLKNVSFLVVRRCLLILPVHGPRIFIDIFHGPPHGSHESPLDLP